MAASLKIRMFGDPCLRQISTSLENVGLPQRMIIQSMIATMHQEKGVGLAAPQVGINQRFFVADVGDGPIAIINPHIIRESGLAEMEEGCLSIPEVLIKVQRSEKIVLRYMDEEGKLIEKAFSELMARVILHETDHLDGKLIVDYASFFEKQKYKKQLKMLESSYVGDQ
ncbi:Peptide deformylase [hydrothermal vent metagenome]|uniref:Peptide deformylase n=1 Tax=hydrothermal vent metagenome TaxID=652676 RepID=A0A3B1DNH9_9ZZZZ